MVRTCSDEEIASKVHCRVDQEFDEFKFAEMRLRDTFKYRDLVAALDLHNVANHAAFCVTRWRDAGNFARHFNGLASATMLYQAAPHPKKHGKVLAPRDFESFTAAEFAFMRPCGSLPRAEPDVD